MWTRCVDSGDNGVVSDKMKTYKDIITQSCSRLAKDRKVVFVGYNTVCGSRMYGTLAGVPRRQCIETPVAENLMMGLGMGLSLEGYKPVVCFERMNFMLPAADAIIHHLALLPELSGRQFSFNVVIRAVIGYPWPLDPGKQHVGNYVDMFKGLYGLVVFDCLNTGNLKEAYEAAFNAERPVLIVERKMFFPFT